MSSVNKEKVNLYCLFSSEDFKPFFIGISENSGNLELIQILSEVFEGSKKNPHAKIRKFLTLGYEIYAHDLQTGLDRKTAKEEVKFWQSELTKPSNHSLLGDDFQDSMQKKFSQI